jgi:hypothetical protein
MANLLWKTSKETKSLASTPFSTEEEFERLVFDTPAILEDIFLLKRQIRGGSKSGIPDIIGIDNDGNVCILEMKNVEVDARIIPQVLQYAFWAEENPDSIKSLWLECENKPDDLSISWEDFEVRIIIIAPRILPSTLDIVKKINYAVDLVEVKRWMNGDDQLLLVNKLEPEIDKPRIRTVSGHEKYDEEFYKKERNLKSVAPFMRYCREVESLVKRKGWLLETKYNKHYCGYKSGFFNAFGVKWVTSKTFAFFFKISQAEARKVKMPMTRYEAQWKEAVYYIDPSTTKVRDFAPLFEFAYKKLTGQ